MSWKDHFSHASDDYRRWRPGYPDELFAWLAAMAPSRAVAWDCATGSGQAAGGLAAHFARVVATDASAAQVAEAEAFGRVEYRVAPAEDSGLPDASVDLVTVAQALHWFEFERFFPKPIVFCMMTDFWWCGPTNVRRFIPPWMPFSKNCIAARSMRT